MLNELQVESLRFTHQEAEEFLAEGADFLDERLMTTVLERAEGWVTGLHLAALSLHQAPDLPEIVDVLTTRNSRYIIDYLFDQVLHRQEPNVQDFLIKTSILGRLSPSLARAVMGPSESVPTRLVEVARAGLFLNALDSNGEWYIYHILFREALQKALQETLSPVEIARLHLQASEWFLQHDLVDEALEHALAGGDSSRAVHVVASKVADLLNSEGWLILERWLSRLPTQAIDRHPLLLVAKAYILTYQLQWDAALQVIRQAESLMGDPQSELDTDERAVTEALLHWIWAYHWLGELEPEKTFAAAERALSLLPAGHVVAASTILHVLSSAQQWLGEFQQAERTINGALTAQSAGIPNPQVTLDLLFALTTLYMAEGYLVPGEQTGQLLLEKSRQTGAQNMEAWACLELGAAAYFANKLVQATGYFSEGVRLRYGTNILASEQCLVGLALSYQALSRSDEARGVLAIMRDFHRQMVNPVLNLEYRSVEARLALMNGNIDLARQWSGDSASDAGLALGWFVVPSLTNIRIRLVDDPSAVALEQIEEELDRLLAKLARLRQPTRQIELLALKAVALAKQGKKERAYLTLEEALTLGEPRGLIRPLIDAGPQLVPWLQAIARHKSTPYLARVLDALQAPRPNTGMMTNKPPHLTPREREVLYLLGQYQTDRAIAEALVVSPLTVRSHIENLAEKLGVRGRRHIVDRARELALIP
jgi:LuxR family maltose regulon positive regulatory protein